MSQELGRILGARVTRRGTVFSDFVLLPENVDLDALINDAAGRDDEDDVDILQSDFEDDDSRWDGDPPAQDGRSSPLTPISDEEDDSDDENEDGGDDPTLPPPRAPLPCSVTGKNSAQRKSKRQRKEKRQAEGSLGPQKMGG
ncbi:hypothetical protein EV122DRAFT_284691 [Schizophyllum commune]